jgi:DNA-binding transcriptional MerR regulator
MDMELKDLTKYKNRNDIRLDELIDVANSFIGLIAPEQPSERVSERLNERALRYYISEGIIDRPVGKSGTSSLYSNRHLLQILALKRLQSSFLPIKQIKEVLPDKSDDELRGIVAGKPDKDTPKERQDALFYLDSLLPENHEKARVEIPATGKRKPYPKSLQPNLSLYESKSSFSEAKPPAIESWERFVLDDGIELNIRSDRLGELRPHEMKRTLERTLNLLKHKNRQRKK